ncbi:MAG: SusC/RagA family TonB-linked outer membrane protein [Bacteroides sp.]|nr:SusC/RagA family TonB-linked outer membrane protein [Bacteroides sp.]
MTYRFKVTQKHNFNVLIGQEIVSAGDNNNYMKAKYFSRDLSPEKIFANMGLNSGELGSSTVTSYVKPDNNMASFFGRLGYNFDDRYLFTFTFRADGSSKFAPGNQWGYFPAAAFAWRMSEESFMENTRDWLSSLKFRLSYGSVGNNRIADSLYKLDYKISTSKPYGVGEISNPYYEATNSIMANPKLKWETTITRNLGLDFGIFNERFTGNMDLYWNTTKDLLITSAVVAPGYETQQRNVGQTSNRGVELTLNAYIIEKKNYSLSANFNIGINKSKVDKLADGILEQEYRSDWASSDLTGRDDYRVIVGQPIGLIYGFVTDGYYTTDDFAGYEDGKYILKTGADGKPVAPETSVATGRIGVRPGAIKFKDLDGDGKITLEDRKIIGKTTPKHTGGFGLNGTVYGFDMSVMFNWVYGNKIYNANKIASSQEYRTTNPNLLGFMKQSNRYSYIDENGKLLTSLADLAAYNEGANAKEYWSPLSFGSANVVPHSWAIEDGSFLCLQNITVGYTIPKKYTRKFTCELLRVYCTLNNVYCWTNYTGYDPEVSSPVRNSSTSGLTPGVDFSSYPKSFSWTLGANITF